jgi:4a-hydroxytetrahydrobiopterin dehydratase
MPQLLDDAAISEALTGLAGWTRDGDAIVLTAELPSFPAAIGLLGHHPDIDIRWRTLTFRCSTHSEGGITELDTRLAASISLEVRSAGG